MNDFSRLEINRIAPDETPWLLSSENTASNGIGLCDACAILDFKTLLAHPFTHYRYPKTGVVNYPRHHRLSTIRYVRETQKCAFCSLIWHAMQVNSGGKIPPESCLNGEDVDVELFSSAYGSHGLLDIYTPTRTAFAVRLELSLNPRGSLMDSTSQALEPFRILIQQLGRSNAKQCMQGLAVPIDELRVYDIDSWIRHCDREHQDLCNADFPAGSDADADELRSPRRLIDITSECIIDTSIDCTYRYATLSYVWGGVPFFSLRNSTMHQLRQPGFTSTRNTYIPRTIRDAINLCQKLKTPYLWVDALCINQDAQEEKDRDIGMMDQIYAMSYLTIVAADGDHADAGLPGMS